MGYKAPVKVFVLRFEADEYEGLEIKAKSLPFGEFLRLGELAKQFKGAESGDQALNEALETLCKSIKSWNLEDEDGKPLPVSVASLMELDFDFVMSVFTAWMDGISGVTGPLDKKSPGGQPLGDVASLPRETL